MLITCDPLPLETCLQDVLSCTVIAQTLSAVLYWILGWCSLPEELHMAYSKVKQEEVELSEIIGKPADKA